MMHVTTIGYLEILRHTNRKGDDTQLQDEVRKQPRFTSKDPWSDSGFGNIVKIDTEERKKDHKQDDDGRDITPVHRTFGNDKRHFQECFADDDKGQ
ncbi:unannotated protein [freshwater metagenome]|uniref:Unannotated protein n=1 Tax=freshwater metagenome TaxID=449393 RepID=A0A6J5ZZX9_9ZZZZ